MARETNSCDPTDSRDPDPANFEMGRQQEVLLGICGGVGPAAGLQLHQLLLEHTDSGGEDQGHLNVAHCSRSEDMTDRTEFLLHGGVENPACGMARTFAMLRAAATQTRARLVVGVPCNTFHAKPIWDEFLARTHDPKRALDSVRYVHMLRETAAFIAERLPSCRRIGLLSTTGTRQSRVYHDLLTPLGYSIVEVGEALQPELHESIYNRDWGIKSTAPRVSARARANFHRYALQLQERGAEVIVLGCTEIPFAFTGRESVAGLPLIDPMVALARGMIRVADPTRLKRDRKPVELPPSMVAVQPVVTASVPRVSPTPVTFALRGRSASLSSTSVKVAP
jgi:aspartate racemase